MLRAFLITAGLFCIAPTAHAAVTLNTDSAAVMQPTIAAAAANSTFGPSPQTTTWTSDWCGTSTTTDDPTNSMGTQPSFKIAYAYASDDPNNISQYADTISRYAQFASNTVSKASGGTLGVRFDRGLACDPNALDIMTIPLPHNRAYYAGDDRLQKVLQDVKAMGAVKAINAQRKTNWLIFADGLGMNYGAAGQGETLTDDRPGSDNPNANGGLFGVLWGKGGDDFYGNVESGGAAAAMLHELTHELGAVQLTAPDSTGRSHCTDEIDIMCYDDGGNQQRSVCTGSDIYDCGRNDYFNPTGDIIGINKQPIWNVARSPFLCPAVGCASTLLAPQVQLTSSSTSPAAGETIMLQAPWKDPDGYARSFEWDTDGNGSYDYTSSYNQIGVVIEHSTTFRVRATDNDGLTAIASLQITIPTNAPAVNLVAPTESKAGTTFTVSATANTGNSYDYDLDGDGVFEYSAGNTIQVSYPTPGIRTIAVQVTDNNGATSQASKQITIVGTSPTVTVTGISRRYRWKQLRKGIRCVVTANAAVTSTATVTLANTVIGKKNLSIKKGTRIMTVKPQWKKKIKKRSTVSANIAGTVTKIIVTP